MSLARRKDCCIIDPNDIMSAPPDVDDLERDQLIAKIDDLDLELEEWRRWANALGRELEGRTAYSFKGKRLREWLTRQIMNHIARERGKSRKALR